MIVRASASPTSESELTRFEEQIGHRLPREYKEFLLEHNGGKLYPCDFEDSAIGIINCVVRILPLLKEPNRDLREEWEQAKRELGGKYLPFAYDLGGEALCLDLGPGDYGAVYVTDGYVEDVGRAVHVRRLADSFTAFLNLLFDRRASEPIDEVYEIGSKGTGEDVLRYMSKGGNVDDKSRLGASLTLTAVAHGNMSVLRACMGLGADLSGAVTVSVLNQEWETMRFLVMAGADVNEVYEKTGKRPLESIHGVFGDEREKIVHFLKAHGAR